MAFSDNVWWTRKARIQTEKRLLANAFQSQVLLLWYSFAGVAVSIYYLKFNNNNTDLAGIAWVIYSVLVLCMSGFINGLSFKERAGLIKECYETLNGIYQKIKAKDADVTPLVDEYDQVLSVCENHTDGDYYLALCEAYMTHQDPKNKDIGLDRLPTKYHWLAVGWTKLKRCMMLSLLYSLPLAMFAALMVLP